jgi:hypothetical protein
MIEEVQQEIEQLGREIDGGPVARQAIGSAIDRERTEAIDQRWQTAILARGVKMTH